jgi:hypothetical protein
VLYVGRSGSDAGLLRAAAPRGTHDFAAWNPLASGTLTEAAATTTHDALRMAEA